MFSFYVFLIFCCSGSFGARQKNIEFGRAYHTRLSRDQHQAHSLHNRWSLESNQIYRTNDYDDYSGRLTELQPSLHNLYAPKTTTLDDEKITIKVHEPRQDPKLFYQSEAYLKEVNGQNVNHEVASIYPGRQFVRADEKYRVPKYLLRSLNENRFYSPESKICIQCPNDRTLIAKVGADRVLLQSPLLKTCSGRKAPKNVRFVHMYGPKFGALLEHGSHVVLGRLIHNNETLHLCKIQVHVIIQSCPTPKYLIPHCEDKYKLCNFTCRDVMSELHGSDALFCGDDMKWEGVLPTCKVRNWCKPLSPLNYGQISCRGETLGSSLRIAEGSRCRIRCPPGWRWYQKAVAVCRRGMWSNTLKCIPKKNNARY